MGGELLQPFYILLPSTFPDLPTGQGDKTGTMLSDGAIYSSIDFTTKANYNSPGQTSQATPYATTQILHSSSIHELAVDLPEAQWKASLQAKQEMANLGYSLPDKNSCNNSKLHRESECFSSSFFFFLGRRGLFPPCKVYVSGSFGAIFKHQKQIQLNKIRFTVVKSYLNFPEALLAPQW